MGYVTKNHICLFFLLSLSLIPTTPRAQWNVVSHDQVTAGIETDIASITNEEGYRLEIYRDTVGAVRSRFTLKNGLLKLAEKTCPTYQIDRGLPQNRSLNNAPCLSGDQWAEFILGYIKNNVIASSSMLAVMNGIAITFRFKLSNGDYRETRFSLYGSKRAMLSAFGGNIQVTTSN